MASNTSQWSHRLARFDAEPEPDEDEILFYTWAPKKMTSGYYARAGSQVTRSYEEAYEQSFGGPVYAAYSNGYTLQVSVQWADPPSTGVLVGFIYNGAVSPWCPVREVSSYEREALV